MISAQTRFRVCREGKPVSTFPNHALSRSRAPCDDRSATSAPACHDRLRQRRDAMRVFHKLSLLSGVVAAGSGAAFCSVAWQSPARAEIPAVVARQRAEKTSFTDAEIVEGFLKTAF